MAKELYFVDTLLTVSIKYNKTLEALSLHLYIYHFNTSDQRKQPVYIQHITLWSGIYHDISLTTGIYHDISLTSKPLILKQLNSLECFNSLYTAP